MKYTFKIHNDPDGYWAECVELDGCVTQGDSQEELEKNMSEALNLYLEERPGSNMVDPLPLEIPPVGNEYVQIQVDPEIAFSVVLRYTRRQHGMTQKEVAEKLGAKSLFGYQRYEARSNPKLSTIRKLLEIFPDFPVDLVLN
ncbi:MAG: type II toxin-antitoxin system HicB family antitoxin [Spirochaetales bacterium]|nr:type II toxin-antitoxin system HicB family antitoxin [Spirochaetales bacterium]